MKLIVSDSATGAYCARQSRTAIRTMFPIDNRERENVSKYIFFTIPVDSGRALVAQSSVPLMESSIIVILNESGDEVYDRILHPTLSTLGNIWPTLMACNTAHWWHSAFINNPDVMTEDERKKKLPPGQ